jgi:hypothetical protein
MLRMIFKWANWSRIIREFALVDEQHMNVIPALSQNVVPSMPPRSGI